MLRLCVVLANALHVASFHPCLHTSGSSQQLQPASSARHAVTCMQSVGEEVAPKITGRGRGAPYGRSRGRGRSGPPGVAFELKNPMYAVRKAPPTSVARAPAQQRSGVSPQRSFSAGGAQNRASYDQDPGFSIPAPSADSDGGQLGLPGGKESRRRKEAPKGRGEEHDSRRVHDGPRRGQLRARRGLRESYQDDVSAGALEGRHTFAPQRRRKSGKRNGTPPPPPLPKGPVTVRLGDSITVGELAEALEVGAAEVVKDLMKMGVLASMTQSIDTETAEKVALGFGAEVKRAGWDDDEESDNTEKFGGVLDDQDECADLLPRPPVVTVMGHVDHGKTSLLDALRASDIASGEAGGITQHIGASMVKLSSGDSVTFIDTPGHAAFSEMRARGANVTDIVILVVAADDGVKEQTLQSIAAAKAAGVPIVVAINKIDKPDVDSSKVVSTRTPHHSSLTHPIATQCQSPPTHSHQLITPRPIRTTPNTHITPFTSHQQRRESSLGRSRLPICPLRTSNMPAAHSLSPRPPPQVKMQLLEHELVLEEFGGDILAVPVSATEGTNLDTLLEQLVLQAELLDLKANPARAAAGVVVEARQLVGQGAVATALVQKGTLRIGDIVVAGAQWGRVRRLSVNSKPVDVAGPSFAVELIGLNGLPAAGDAFIVTADESKARQIAEVRQQLLREKRASSLFAARSSSAQNAFLAGASTGELPVRIVDLVVKSDVQGSAEALCSALEQLEVADDLLRVKTRVLRSGAGAITSEDVMLASVSDALVLGFNSQAARPTLEQAEQANVLIKEYTIIYDLLDDVKTIMSSYIRPPPAKHLGVLVGTADVLQTFKIGAIGKVAGCRVLDGHVSAGCKIRILRGNSIEYEGRLNSLRSVKDEVDRIDAVIECGMAFHEYQDMLPEDRVEAYASNDE